MGIVIVMRHGKRNLLKVDGPLKTFNEDDLLNCCPEVTESIINIKKDFENKNIPFKIGEIISSPYLRTRQTALIAQAVYKYLTGKNVDIYLNTRLGEYSNKALCIFGNPKKSQFDPITLEYYGNKLPPLCKENNLEFKDRIEAFNEELDKGIVTLVITHQYPMIQLCKINGLTKNIKKKMADYNIFEI